MCMTHRFDAHDVLSSTERNDEYIRYLKEVSEKLKDDKSYRDAVVADIENKKENGEALDRLDSDLYMIAQIMFEKKVRTMRTHPFKNNQNFKCISEVSLIRTPRIPREMISQQNHKTIDDIRDGSMEQYFFSVYTRNAWHA